MKPHGDLAAPDVVPGLGDLDGLRRLAARLVRDDADADDVVQDSLLLALRRAAGRVADAGAWLRGVVRNKARESRRSATRRAAHESHARPGASPMTPIDIAARVEIHDQLIAAVKRLPDPYRNAVWLHHVEGRDASEIARDSGVPVETIRTRVKRGVARLREDLDGRQEGGRAAWVPALAAFAGVQPTIPIVAAAAAASTVTVAKAAAAAVVLVVVGGSAIIGFPKLLGTREGPPSESVRPKDEREHPPVDVKTSNREPPAVVEAGQDERGPATRRDPDPRDPGMLMPGRPGNAPADLPTGDTFAFHYQQGFSFESRTVTDDVAEADVVFKTCAGGIASVTLEAPGGAIASFVGFKQRFTDVMHAVAFMESAVRVDADAFGAGTTRSGDVRDPHSDAFVVRTRRGQWVAMAIVGRASEGDWKKMPVTIRYVLANAEGRFRSELGDVTIDGIQVDSRVLLKIDAELNGPIVAAIKARLAELDRKAAALEPGIQAQEGADVRVAAVLDRKFAKPLGFNAAYVAATYSFEKATRDDVKAANNDWDFVLQTSEVVDVQTVVDDQSLAWDLGDGSFRSARAGEVPQGQGRERFAPKRGRLYAIHTVDSETDLWALMRVEELTAGESMIFSWAIVEKPEGLAAALEPPEDDAMPSPHARLQIRGGAGGGNPHRVRLDRSAERIDKLAGAPLDLSKPLSINEPHAAWVQGGRVPRGMVFIIERIDYVAKVEGDTNGPGEFTLWVGPLPIARVRESDRSEPARRSVLWFDLERGSRPVDREVAVRGSLSTKIPILPGQEYGVFVEIRNSSWADVTLHGRFERREGDALGVKRVRPDHWVLFTLEQLAEGNLPTTDIARSSGESVPTLRGMLEMMPQGVVKERLRRALDQAGR
jgi:RNA polymerase sigma-70 factor (ECF subfamily)